MTYGDIAIGGRHGYVQILDADGELKDFVQQTDDRGRELPNVMGVSWDEQHGHLYTAITPHPSMPYTPHDIRWLPDGSGLLVAVVPEAMKLEFRRYSCEGELLDTWPNIRTDQGWAKEHVKIDIALDNETVFYTDSMRTIFTWNLETGRNEEFASLENGSRYIFSAVRIVPTAGGEVALVTAMSLGPGPRLAIALRLDGTVWADEKHGGVWQATRRWLDNGWFIDAVTTQPGRLLPVIADGLTAALVGGTIAPGQWRLETSGRVITYDSSGTTGAEANGPLLGFRKQQAEGSNPPPAP